MTILVSEGMGCGETLVRVLNDLLRSMADCCGLYTGLDVWRIDH